MGDGDIPSTLRERGGETSREGWTTKGRELRQGRASEGGNRGNKRALTERKRRS